MNPTLWSWCSTRRSDSQDQDSQASKQAVEGARQQVMKDWAQDELLFMTFKKHLEKIIR